MPSDSSSQSMGKAHGTTDADNLVTSAFLLYFSVFNEAKALLSGSIFAQILTNGVWLACSILQIDLFFGQWAPQLFYGVYTIILSTLNAFLFCFFATKTSHDLRMMAARVYAAKWYQMEIARQKENIMMIIFAQFERNLDGLGIIYCNLETFSRVNLREILFKAQLINFKRYTFDRCFKPAYLTT